MRCLKKYILQFFIGLFLSIYFNVAFSDGFPSLKILMQQIKSYKCPLLNKDLSKNLLILANNRSMINQICAANPVPRDCLQGPFSLKNEAIGLSNITKNPS